MKTTRYLASMGFLLLSLFMTQCVYEELPEPEPVEIPDVVSFSTDIIPIFQANCVTCHGFNDPDLTPDNAYNSLSSGGYLTVCDAENSLLISALDQSQHSTLSITEAEIETITKWISQGAIDN